MSAFVSVFPHSFPPFCKSPFPAAQPAGRQFVPLLHDMNLVDQAWGAARPAAPGAPIRVHSMQWAGESTEDKLARIRKQVWGKVWTLVWEEGGEVSIQWAGESTEDKLARIRKQVWGKCGHGCGRKGVRLVTQWAGESWWTNLCAFTSRVVNVWTQV